MAISSPARWNTVVWPTRSNNDFQGFVVPGSGWILFDAIITLIRGGLIAYPWPGSSLWAVGTPFGVNLPWWSQWRMTLSVRW